jgi:TRAP-type uncharacterized transport system fused permease subunit
LCGGSWGRPCRSWPGIFLAYCLFGNYLPAPFDHRGYSLEQVIEHMSFGTEGLYATPTLVSATYIFLFILFGAFLERAGMIQLFTDVAMGLFGGAKGGPARLRSSPPHSWARSRARASPTWSRQASSPSRS